MSELNQLSELDSIQITNPTNEDFTCRFNGEPYLIRAGETQPRPKFLAVHMAKKLSDHLISQEVQKLTAKKAKDKDINPYDPAVTQLTVHDNPTRRKFLYSILRSKELVEATLNDFGFKGFVGEMREYDDFVAKLEAKGGEKSSKAE